jgi:hypothetical protein
MSDDAKCFCLARAHESQYVQTTEQGFVESIATGNAPHNTLQGIPVRYLMIRD